MAREVGRLDPCDLVLLRTDGHPHLFGSRLRLLPVGEQEEYERLCETSQAMIYAVMRRLMLR